MNDSMYLGTTKSTQTTKSSLKAAMNSLRTLLRAQRGLCGSTLRCASFERRGSGLLGTVATVFVLCASGAVHAQGPFGPPPGPPKTPKEAARVDLTGYWVSIVTEDWRFRMVTAPKGDHPNVPLNAEGKKVADAWDPAKDEAAADKCKAYGAPNIMRQPGRLHITWADDTTLKVETDAGIQTRLLKFGPPPVTAPRASRQGSSAAEWIGRGSLKVVTSGLLPGYLQTNGVPYGGRTTMTEHFDVVKEPNGDQWLIVDTIVEDPQYLFRSFIRSTHFRKQADATGWDPTPCFVQ